MHYAHVLGETPKFFSDLNLLSHRSSLPRWPMVITRVMERALRSEAFNSQTILSSDSLSRNQLILFSSRTWKRLSWERTDTFLFVSAATARSWPQATLLSSRER